ncbi:MAG: DUF2069 domain-containing protein [Tahibacter sp.]
MNWRTLGVAAWIGLIVLHLAWSLWLAPPTGSIWPGLIFALTPLLLAALALRQSLQRALLWVGVLSLFYFSHGVALAWSEPRARAPAVLEVALCLLLIGALGWQSRHYQRAPRPGS